jgi:hypothetical protein
MVVVVDFPNQMLVDAFGGYGRFRLNKLLGLARQENKPDLFPKSIEYYFGFPLDQWFVFPKDKLPVEKGEFRSFLVKKTRLLFLTSPKHLGLTDRLSLFNFSRFLNKRSFSWQIFDASEEGWLTDDNRLKKPVWDSWAEAYLADGIIKNEDLDVGVYNTTEKTGLAQQTARMLRNSGMRVVKVGNADKRVGECLIGLASEGIRKSITFRRLSGLLGCQVVVLPTREFVDLTDINIYLGDAFLSGLKKDS